MTRDDWLDAFRDELAKLRPHLLGKLGHTIALQKFDPNERPRDMARQHDKALRATDPPVPAKKRSK
jgi:hypothetical protein